ncbi:MAG: hypothetical protein ACI8QZ_002476 [Chlamydiales bacterium]|jgi:uncharacterized protein involved in cysteine biosynthesis
MLITPCRLCGYDAPGPECPICRMQPADPSLARTAAIADPAARPPGLIANLSDGVRAIPMAFLQLRRTRRVMRVLIPPVMLTSAVFVVAFAWLWRAIGAAFETAAESAQQGAGEGDGWIAGAVRWSLNNPALGFLADLGHWIFVLGAGYLLAVWTFSLVYEALAGPFLDEVHARLEARWFGLDPRQRTDRPTELTVRECSRRTLLAGSATVVLAIAGSVVSGTIGRGLLLVSPLPFVALAMLEREYGRWLIWVMRSESSALWTSAKAAAFAGMLLLLFFWVKFIPVVGLPIFLGIAGFATAISLLDIPFSRRRWSFGQRLSFLRHHLAPLTAFGLVASALFVLLPLIGLLVTVPLASVGGLWLICRLDKAFLRA